MIGMRAAAGVALLAAWLTGAAQAAELSVDEAVAMALAQNTSLQITQLGEARAQAELAAARGRSGVSLSAGSSFVDSRIEGRSRTDEGTASLSLSLPLYTGGRNEAQIRSGEIGCDAAALTTERAREKLRYEVIKGCYDLLEAQRAMAIAQESADNYASHLAHVEQLYEAGRKARLDVLRSSVALTNARQTLIRAQSEYEVKGLALKEMLGLPQQEPLVLKDKAAAAPFSPSVEDCVNYALRQQKGLLIRGLELQQKAFAVAAAQAGRCPQVNFSLSTSAEKKFQPRQADSTQYTAALRLQWNIFDSGATEAAVAGARTAQQAAELALHRDEVAAERSIRQAYHQMREAERRFDSARAAVDEAREHEYIAREKYRVGQGILLDIIDAQLALSEAELNFSSAQYDYGRYRALVEYASGLSLHEGAEVMCGAALQSPLRSEAAMMETRHGSAAAGNGGEA